MNIRTATNADSGNIKTLVFSVLREYGLAPDSSGTDKDLDDIERYYSGNHGFFGVVEEGSDIVATVGLLRIDDDTCELRKMYALPHVRGRGLGKQLLEFALARTRALGYRRVILETASPLKEAVSLYQRYGFKRYVPAHLSSRCDQAFALDLAAASPGGSP